jgi:hypothetical protein
VLRGTPTAFTRGAEPLRNFNLASATNTLAQFVGIDHGVACVKVLQEFKHTEASGNVKATSVDESVVEPSMERTKPMNTITTKDNTNRSSARRGSSEEFATAQAKTIWSATYDLLRALKLTTVFGNPGSTEQPFLKNFPADF